jgi:MFS family permease
VLVGGLGLLIVVAFGSVLYGFSVYATDDAAGAVFSTSLLSVALTGSTIVNGLLAPGVGRYGDRHGVRTVIAVGSLLLGSGLMLFSFASEGWQVVAAWWLLIGPSTAMVYYDPAIVALNQWLPAEMRPKAFGAITVIGGISAVVFIPLAGFLVESLGWRPAVRLLGVFSALVGLAVAAFVVPRGTPDHLTAAVERASLRSLRSDRRWMLFTGAVVIAQIGLLATIAHRVDRYVEAGFPLVTVAALAGAASLISLPGRFVGPVAAARTSGTVVFAMVMGGVAASAVIAALPGSGGLMVSHFVVFGLAFGAFTAVRAVVMSGWYGPDRFGAVNGAQSAVALILGSLGPLAIGVGRDMTGGYRLPFALLALALSAGMALSVRAGRV